MTMRKQIAAVMFFLMALCLLVALSACTGQLDVFDDVEVQGIVPPTAMQEFDATGGNTVHFTDAEVSIANSVTVVTGRDAQNNVTFPLACGNTMTWNVQGLDPVNFNYWVTRSIVVTYDPARFQCGQTWRCDVPRDANGNAVAGSVVLEQGFGARLGVVCTRLA